MKIEDNVAKYVGEQIRKYRKMRKLTQKELGFKIGVKHNTISGYESGTNEPEQNVLYAIADILSISINDLFPSPTNVTPAAPQTVPIPLLGDIACGEPLLTEDNIEGYIYESPDMLPSGELFYLRAKGDSMEPTIPDGSYVLIRQQPEVENGDIAAVLFEDQSRATLKRVRKQEGGITILSPDNKNYEPIAVTSKAGVRILGKAMQFTQKL